MLDHSSNYSSGSKFDPRLADLMPKTSYTATTNPTTEKKVQPQTGSETPSPQPIQRYNFLIEFEIDERTAKLATVKPLRVVVEEYSLDEGTEFLAFWALNNTFVGHGMNQDDAIEELAINFLHDYLFYTSKKASELTADAQNVKKLLRTYFVMKK